MRCSTELVVVRRLTRYPVKSVLFAIFLALFLSASDAKTFDVGSGTIELPEDFEPIHSPAHDPFGHGFRSRQRGLFIGWIVDGQFDSPPEKKIGHVIATTTGQANGLAYRLSVTKLWDTRLVITFSQTSFWCDVKSQSDLDYVKSLLLTFTPKSPK